MLTQTLSCIVLGAQCTTVEGNDYVKLFVAQPTTDTSRAKGLEVMSMSTSKAVFDKLSMGDQPVQADVIARMQIGSKNTMRMVAEEVQLKATKPATRAQ